MEKLKLDLVRATERDNVQNEQKEILRENLIILRTDERHQSSELRYPTSFPQMSKIIVIL